MNTRTEASPDLAAPQHLLPWLKVNADLFDAVLLDIDGVLVNESRLLPGSLETLRWLQANGKPFLLLTNDACNSPDEKVQPLQELGLPLQPGHVVSSGHCISEFVPRIGAQGRMFFLMGSLGDPCYAAAAGLVTTREATDLPRCTGVVIGEKHYDWELVISAVLNQLVSTPQLPLIVPNPDRFFLGAGGQLCLASGAVARFLQELCREQGCSVTPNYLGKPNRSMFAFAHARLEGIRGASLSTERVLMVGDSLSADIRGGNDFGYRTALLLSGITSPEALTASDVQPDWIFASL